MKVPQYIKYFLYLSWNWNVRIAFHIIIQEIKGEKKYQLATTGADELLSLEEKGIDISHSTIYMPAGYDVLEKAFSFFRDNPPVHLLDLGCGKGRALCVAAHFHIFKSTGLDISRELCIDAKKNLERTKITFPSLDYNIINNDAFYFDIPDDVDGIFLFNPFDEIIMQEVVENINQSLLRSPRLIHIIYINPMHKELFFEKDYETVFYFKKLKYLEVLILKKSPPNERAVK